MSTIVSIAQAHEWEKVEPQSRLASEINDGLFKTVHPNLSKPGNPRNLALYDEQYQKFSKSLSVLRMEQRRTKRLYDEVRLSSRLAVLYLIFLFSAWSCRSG